MLIPLALLPAVISSDFLPNGEILESNHQTDFVDFYSKVLFGEEITDLNNSNTVEVKAEFTHRNLF